MGNTLFKPNFTQLVSMSQRSRAWCVTINNPEQKEIEEFRNLPYDFKCFEMEKGENETPHIQGFIYHNSQIRFNTLKKKIPRAHLEVAHGSIQQNIEYCSKENNGTYEEIGIPPKSVAKEKERKEFKSLDYNEIIEEGEKDCSKKTMDNLLAQRYFTGIKLQMKVNQEILEDKLKKPKVIYYFGDSGSGKTYSALKFAVENYGIQNVSKISFANGFANCTNPHAKCLVYDEFRPSQIDAATFLTLTDCYGVQLNIKHSFVFIRPKCLIITSIKHPDEIYRDEINQQFKRRITQFINMNENPWKEKEVEEIHFNPFEKIQEVETEENINVNIDKAINKYLYQDTLDFVPQSTARK